MRNQQAEQGRVEYQVCEITRRLDLGHVTIHNKFVAKTLDDDPRTVCVCKADWEYRQASLTWYLPNVATLEDREIRDTAIHELVHALNAPIWEELPATLQNRLAKNNELATENCTRAIISVLDTRPFPD